ncbi:MAG: Tat pathway signal protein [Betaproteobacteria bacterium]|jgi:tripartite-type tricarboxylate transporter receptor subunit TctC|nr:Tat pathway signal protein [Betaproteobacteria bacterium]MEA3154353.1 putative tricarboxylic transport rane protein [Betaproteobacteria bacterium]
MVRYLISCVVLAAAGLVGAQDNYPSKPIQMVVPFPPGGVADITGRPTALVMSKLLRQPIVIVNKPGAGGAIGMATVAKGRADGYTLLMALSSVSIIPVAERLQGREPSYELNQLAPVALISADPTVLVVRADGPYKTIKDFVAAAKSQPGKINYGSSGVYGTLHVAMEIFAQAAGIRLYHIPYQGGGPAVTALLGGQIEALASGPSAAIAQIKGGKMRALGVWGDKRLASLPEVPSMKELGYDATFYIWSGLFAPSGTPAPIMQKLRSTVRSTVNDPEFKDAMSKIDTPIAYLDAPEFQPFLARDAKRLEAAVIRIGKVDEK